MPMPLDVLQFEKVPSGKFVSDLINFTMAGGQSNEPDLIEV
jgi:hypothetical protein